jgi:hypothetical protein
LSGVLTASAPAATGDLVQKPGSAGCISETGAGPCADGSALDFDSDAVAVFDRG